MGQRPGCPIGIASVPSIPAMTSAQDRILIAVNALADEDDVNSRPPAARTFKRMVVLRNIRGIPSASGCMNSRSTTTDRARVVRPLHPLNPPDDLDREISISCQLGAVSPRCGDSRIGHTGVRARWRSVPLHHPGTEQPAATASRPMARNIQRTFTHGVAMSLVERFRRTPRLPEQGSGRAGR